MMHGGRSWNWKGTWERGKIGTESGTGEGGTCGKKTETSDGLLRGTGVCCQTYLEGFRYQAGGDQHQGLERSPRAVCRWQEMGGGLVNGGGGQHGMVGKRKERV